MSLNEKKLEEAIQYYKDVYQVRDEIREKLEINVNNDLQKYVSSPLSKIKVDIKFINRNTYYLNIKPGVTSSKPIELEIQASPENNLESFIESYENAYFGMLNSLNEIIKEKIKDSKAVFGIAKPKVSIDFGSYDPLLDLSSKIEELEYLKDVLEENRNYHPKLESILNKKEEMYAFFKRIKDSTEYKMLFFKKFNEESQNFRSKNELLAIEKYIKKIIKEYKHLKKYLELPATAAYYHLKN
ncbi:MAG: hypothetical protein PWP03_713 [Candidatus Woesearchaeota archaeon]|nr:hypothetical protein [Candidatus Woesearchaeota archaeon]MDN5328075.1 hypothetical protein [Candidatus Woesearchaeota archaeon]